MTPRLLTVLLLLPTLLLASVTAQASPEKPVEGEDYAVIADGKPLQPLNGKVEVVEAFSYTCIHCAHFEPTVSAWARKQPAWVRFTPVPVAFNSAAVPYARAYYAAEISKVLATTHAQVFKALFEDGSLPMHNPTAGELTGFYARYGVDAAKFEAVLRGPAVTAKLEQARDFLITSQIEGTPSLIINGKYRVTGGSTFEDQLRIADYLIARERRGGK